MTSDGNTLGSGTLTTLGRQLCQQARDYLGLHPAPDSARTHPVTARRHRRGHASLAKATTPQYRPSDTPA